jgi:hypothetical protein
MKSFVAYPTAFQKALIPAATAVNSAGQTIPQCELFKKVTSLNGSIVKCGISPDEAFNRFQMFRQMLPANAVPTMIAFEKHPSAQSSERNPLQTRIDEQAVVIDDVKSAMVQKGSRASIEFMPGHVDDAIPSYLIENPELKIAYLEIDLDEYEATMTSLEFLFPRIMQHGILVINNYFKKSAEFKAVHDYFANVKIAFHSFSVNNGPHYLVLN